LFHLTVNKNRSCGAAAWTTRLYFVWPATSFTFRVADNELKHDGDALVAFVRATGG
jgi:hypothetical protein